MDNRIRIKVKENFEEKLAGLEIGYIYFQGVNNTANNPIVDDAIRTACEEVIKRYKDTNTIAENPTIKGIRSLFSKIGIDPTKERPSGEALIRRVTSGKGIYRINPVVDINNVVSILSGYPCGVYDAEKIAGNEIKVSIGGKGSTFEGIGGRLINGEGRILTEDSHSVFGGPVADSNRTRITPQTTKVLMLIYHPSNAPKELLKKAIELAQTKMASAVKANIAYADICRIGRNPHPQIPLPNIKRFMEKERILKKKYFNRTIKKPKPLI